MRRQITVLVVLTVLVVGAGLLVAAVSRVQNAAARMQCRNNIKQLGLGLANYHSTYNVYPSATVPQAMLAYKPGKNTFEGLPPERKLSWIVEVVPYLAQMRVLLDRERAWDSPENKSPRIRFRDENDQPQEEPMGEWKVFLCPSNPARADSGSACLTHYVGMAGVGRDAVSRPEGARGIGVFGYYRKTRHEDIKNGASTMLVLETTRENGPWTAGGHPTVRGIDPSGGAYLGENSQFGSNHSGNDCFAWRPPSVTNVVFVDGSVRSLTVTIKPEVFEALGTIAGGEEVQGVDW